MASPSFELMIISRSGAGEKQRLFQPVPDARESPEHSFPWHMGISPLGTCSLACMAVNSGREGGRGDQLHSCWSPPRFPREDKIHKITLKRFAEEVTMRHPCLPEELQAFLIFTLSICFAFEQTTDFGIFPKVSLRRVLLH